MSESRKKGITKVEETPTPMRMMADPTLWHIMPSRTSKRKKEEELMPPPSKKKKYVLEEEEYIDTIGKVIERDYFPELDKYRTHLEYLKAIENRDFSRAEKLKYHLVILQKGETPGATPAVTPYPAGATPKIENDMYSNGVYGDAGDGKSIIVHDVNNNEIKLPANVSIDELSKLVTSEDNKNFEDKQEMELKKMKEKLWWLYDGEDPERKKVMALRDQEEMKMLQDEAERKAWPHRSNDGLMLPPSIEDAYNVCGVQLLKDKAEPRQKLEVVPANTRLRVYQPPSTIEMPAPPKLDPNSQYIATPAPEPGVDFDPIMTWGDIESTPLTLGSAVIPLDVPITPLPTQNKREEIADKLYKKMKSAHKPKINPISGGAPGMSPAAQLLQQRLKGRVSKVDSLLRKSYTPVSASPSIMMGTTPGLTPSLQKKNVKFASTPMGRRSDKKVVLNTKTQSFTDGLL